MHWKVSYGSWHAQRASYIIRQIEPREVGQQFSQRFTLALTFQYTVDAYVHVHPFLQIASGRFGARQVKERGITVPNLNFKKFVMTLTFDLGTWFEDTANYIIHKQLVFEIKT